MEIDAWESAKRYADGMERTADIYDRVHERNANAPSGDEWTELEERLSAEIYDVLAVTVHGHRGLYDEELTTDYVEVLVACGGPDVRVKFYDTNRAEVVYRWGGEHAEYRVESGTAETYAYALGIDEALS